MRTPNFYLEEITREHITGLKLTPEQERMAYIMMGTLQTITFHLEKQLRHNVYTNITSGFRSLEYNVAEYRRQGIANAASAKTSNHIWRLSHQADSKGRKYIRAAVDVQYFKDSPNGRVQIPCSKIFPLLSFFQGEVYWNKAQNIIHIAYQGTTVKNHWIQ